MPQQTDISTPTYFVGIDVAVKAQHVAVLIDDRGKPLGKRIAFGHTVEEYQRVRAEVSQRVPELAPVIWASEVTAGAWRPLAAHFQGQGETFTLQKNIKIADLRNVERRHYKNDQIDAKTIAEATRLDCQRDVALKPPASPQIQATRSTARRIEALKGQIGSAKNRLSSLLCETLAPSIANANYAWCAASMLKVLHAFADLRDIAKLTPSAFIRSACAKTKGGARTSKQALAKLHEAARDSVETYGDDRLHWQAFAVLLREAIQAIWDVEGRIKSLQEQLSELLQEGCSEHQRACGQSVPGVNTQSLDQALAFFGPADRWLPFASLKQYAGLVPIVHDTGNTERSPRMSKLGEPNIRKLVYQIGSTARQHDAEFAACYSNHMVRKGKTHGAACIVTGLRALNILRAVLRDGRQYEYRDPRDGTIITKQESRDLAKTLYRVPDDVRKARRKAKPKTQNDSERTHPPRPYEGRADRTP